MPDLSSQVNMRHAIFRFPDGLKRNKPPDDKHNIAELSKENAPYVQSVMEEIYTHQWSTGNKRIYEGEKRWNLNCGRSVLKSAGRKLKNGGFLKQKQYTNSERTTPGGGIY